MIRLFFIFILVMFIYLNSDGQTITQLIDRSGIYNFGGGIFADPTDINDAILTISANDVILDLGDNVLSQTSTNQVAGLVGVRVINGFRNVVIQNGRIFSVTGFGIEIQQGCQGIGLMNLNINDCDAGGIKIDGISASRVQTVRIDGCTVASCTGAAGGQAQGIILNSVSAVIIQNCLVAGNDALTTSSGYGLAAQDCMLLSLGDCRFAVNGGYQEGAGVYLKTSTNCLFRDCFFNSNIGRSSASDAFAAGAKLEDNKNARFIDCEFSSNINPFANVSGIKNTRGQNMLVQNSLIENNSGGLTSCGIELIHNTRSQCIENTIRNNTAATGYGMKLTGTNQLCFIASNDLISNVGTTTSFGILDEKDPSTSTFMLNRAFNHQTNYFISYPVGISLPRVIGSLSDSMIGLPSNTGGLLDNVDVTA